MSEATHPLEEIVAAIEGGEVDRGLAAHLDGCVECRELFEALETPDARDATGPCEDDVADVARIVEVLDDQTTAAHEWVAARESVSAADAEGALGAFGGGGVRAAMERARDRFQKDPAEALRWADLAIELSSRLGNETERGIALQLKGEAWKDRANALRLLGRLEDGLAAIDEASRAFGDLVVSEPWLAMADYVRATILRELDRCDEALDLAASCADVFRRYGYVDRARHARILEASVRVKNADFREAKRLFLELLAGADAPSELANLHNNVGAVYAELGEFEEAVKHLHLALPLYRALGSRLGEIRARWSIAKILLFQGKAHDALGWLREIRSDFDAMEMTEEAALVGLDVVEGLILADLAGARQLSGELVEYFAKRGNSPVLARAFGYLRECLENETATAETIDVARVWLRESRREPRVVAPPPPDWD